jgi:hypothetical protein
VACSSTTSCQAVGRSSSNQPVVVPVTDGTPGAAKVVPNAGELRAVACSGPTACLAVGTNASSSGSVLLPIMNGTPGSAQAASPESTGRFYELSGVGCSTPTSCTAAGHAIGAGRKGVVASIGLPVVKAATTTKVSATPTAAKVGNPIAFTATVAPTASNPSVPTGTVRFYLDGQTTAAATMTLAAGKATFTTSTLAAGSHTMKANFAGDANFTNSASAPVTVTVTA